VAQDAWFSARRSGVRIPYGLCPRRVLRGFFVDYIPDESLALLRNRSQSEPMRGGLMTEGDVGIQAMMRPNRSAVDLANVGRIGDPSTGATVNIPVCELFYVDARNRAVRLTSVDGFLPTFSSPIAYRQPGECLRRGQQRNNPRLALTAGLRICRCCADVRILGGTAWSRMGIQCRHGNRRPVGAGCAGPLVSDDSLPLGSTLFSDLFSNAGRIFGQRRQAQWSGPWTVYVNL
jgi:hypothetical protein